MTDSMFTSTRGKQSSRVVGMVIGIAFMANAALASPKADIPASDALYIYVPWTQLTIFAESNPTLRTFLENHPLLRAFLKRQSQQPMPRDAGPVRRWPGILPALAGAHLGS